jgi:hypothetical protein
MRPLGKRADLASHHEGSRHATFVDNLRGARVNQIDSNPNSGMVGIPEIGNSKTVGAQLTPKFTPMELPKGDLHGPIPTHIGIYNPRLDAVYRLAVDSIPADIIAEVSRDVIGYE